MKTKWPNEYNYFSEGIDMVKAATEFIIDVLCGSSDSKHPPIVGELTDENCLKADIGAFLRDCLIGNLKL